MFVFPLDLIIFVNVGLVLWLLISIYRGYKRGLLLQVLDWVRIVVALFVAWLFSKPFAGAFPLYQSQGVGLASIDQVITLQINQMIWFFILFVVIQLALLVITPLASYISKMPLIKQVNSSVGGVFSVLFFGLKLVLVCFFLTFPVVKNGQAIIEGSALKYVAPITESIFTVLDSTIDSNAAIQSILLKQTLTPQQNDAMIEWLKSQDFSLKEIQEFLNKHE